jgi:hypothetical protein
MSPREVEMNLRTWATFLSGVLLCLGLAASLDEATSYTTAPWKIPVLNADMVGIVECEIAGEIVAGYRVVESWKGPPAGTVLRIDSGLDYFHQRFPIALVGERYLVFAFKPEAPVATISSFSNGRDFPLWWRRLPSNYHVAVSEGRLLLPGEREKGALWSMGYEQGDLESFRKDARSVLSLDPDGQEAQRLVGGVECYRHGPLKREARRLSNCTSTSKMVAELLRLGRRNSRRGEDAISVLLLHTREESLRVIQSLPESSFPPNRVGLREEIIQRIEWRLQSAETASREEETPTSETPPPEEHELKTLRVQLQDPEHPMDRWKAFDRLSIYDPAFVTDFLKDWEEPVDVWGGYVSWGHVLVSSLARTMKQDRVLHLRTLLTAKDPYVRVGAAIYLSFDEPEEGLLRLKELASLPGDPGAWAALNVVRRGDGSALPRALEVLETPDDGTTQIEMHKTLQSRVEVLVSNIAHLSDAPQPTLPEPLTDNEMERGTQGSAPWQQKLYQSYLGWWRAYKDRLLFKDPWFEELRAQRID